MEFLRKLWHAWKRFGQFIGDLLARVVLTLFYFTLFLPFGLGVTLFSDPLHARPHKPLWHERTHGDSTVAEARRQF